MLINILSPFGMVTGVFWTCATSSVSDGLALAGGLVAVLGTTVSRSVFDFTQKPGNGFSKIAVIEDISE